MGRPKKVKRGRSKKVIEPVLPEIQEPSAPVSPSAELEEAQARLEQLTSLLNTLEAEGIDSVSKLYILIEQQRLKIKEISSH